MWLKPNPETRRTHGYKKTGILKHPASYIAALKQESLALSEGIREAAVTSCIGSLSQLKLRNLCDRKEGVPEFERQIINENLELVSAEGYVQPLEEGGIRVHIHVAAARPSGEMVGGHCEDATCFTGAFMYLQIIEENTGS